MKKITLLILMLFLGFVSSFAQTENFDAGTTLPAGWHAFNNNAGPQASIRKWQVSNIASTSAPNSVRSQGYAATAVGNTTRDWLVTAAYTVPQNGQLQFNVAQLSTGNQNSIVQVKVATAFTFTGDFNSDSSGFTQLAQWTEQEINGGQNYVDAGFEQKTVSLATYTPGSTVYIAFVREYTQMAGGNEAGIFIDDVRVDSRCVTPIGLLAPTINMTNATLSWTNPNNAGGTQWEIVYATSVQTFEQALANNQTLPGAPNVPGGPSNSYTIPAGTLLPRTEYKYYIRAVCSATNKSDWSDPYFFKTAGFGETCVDPIAIPGLPYSISSNTADSNDRTDVIQSTSCVAGTTNYMAGNEVFYSFTALTTGDVRIELAPTGPNASIFVYSSCPASGQACLAGVANTGSGVRVIPSFPVTAGTSYIVVISSALPTQTVGYYLEIQYVTCDEPTALNVPSATMTSATLSWNNPISVVNWQIAVQPAGATIPQGPGYTVSTGGTPANTFTTTVTNLTNGTGLGAALTSGTAYQYWVRGECTVGGGTYSPWAGPFEFITPVCEAVNQCNHIFRLTRSGTGTNGWNGAIMHVRQNGVVVKVLGPQFTSGSISNVTVPLCEDIPFELVWVSGGATPANVGVVVINSYNQTVFQKNAGIGAPGATPLFTETVICDYPRCAPPINQLSSAVTTSSATLTWTNATNISATAWEIYVMPAAEATAPLNTSPVGNTAPGYFGGPAIVTGYVATGLRSDTEYVYYVRTVCDGVRGSNWVGPVTFRTLVSCAFPTNLTAEGQTRTSAVLKWNQVPATINSWEIIVQDPATGVPAYAATGVIVSAPSINYGIDAGTTALLPARQYEYYVRAICSGTDKSRWVGPFLFRTLCDAINVPYTEGFNSSSVNQLCWTPLNGTGTNIWNLDTTAAPFEGDESASIVPLTSSNNSYLISPTLNLLANYRVRFRYKVDAAGANNTVKVLLSTTGVAPTSFTTELWSSTLRNTTYEERVINLGAIAPGPINIAFHLVGAATATRIYIDNVVFEPIPPCPAPQDLAVTDIQSTTATLSWSAGYQETEWQVVVQPAGTGVPANNYTGPTTTNNTAYPADTAGNLDPANTYEYYVRAYCSATQQSSWVGPISFKTLLCDTADLCTYTFAMTDTASNGWGTTMNVIQNGIVVATLNGPANGVAVSVQAIDFCPGVQFELRWNATPGLSNANASQVGITIANSSGTVVYTKLPGAGVPNSTLYRGMPFCAVLACPFPTNLSVAQTSPTSAELSWTPGGSETRWEYIYQPAGGNFPGANPSGAVTVNTTPRANIFGLPQAIKYEFYVRAICGPGNNSYWSGPYTFTVYNSPGCLGVDIDGVVNPTGEERYVCPSPDDALVHLEATYFEVKSTSTYRVDSIPYSPPFPFTGGENSVSLTTDDYWSDVVNLDFNFCFFGTSYDKLLVTDNGAISFSVGGPRGNGGRYMPLEYAGYLFNAPIPTFPAAVTTPPYTNSISGILQDLNPATSPADYSFNYAVVGTAPCRAFVMNIYKVASYSCNVPQTSQIVLYEGSNMIDVYVENRTPCAHNSGSGLIGVQNATGTIGIAAPNRNTSSWAATNEAWRFTPDGPLALPQFEWQLNGTFYSNDLVIDVPVSTVNAAIAATGQAKMEAVATYIRCGNPTPLVRRAEVNIKLYDMPVANPADIILCTTGTTTPVAFDLTSNNPLIISTVPAVDQPNYQISYFLTEAEAEVGTSGDLNGSYTTAVDTQVWARIKNNVSGCVEVRSFWLRLVVAPVFTLSGNTTICTDGSTIISVTPPIPGATYEWTLPDGTVSTQVGEDLSITSADAQAGVYSIKVTNNGCETTAQFTLTISPDIVPVVDFIYNSPVCIAGPNPVAIPVGAPLTTAPGIQFTVDTTSPLVFANAVTGEIDLALTPAGTYRIKYEVIGLPCTADAFKEFDIVIEALENPVTSFTITNATVCSNGTIIPTIVKDAGFTEGGTFTVDNSGLAINATTGAINLAGSTPGVYQVTYSVVRDLANCIDGEVGTPVQVTVTAGINADATFSYLKDSYCSNSPSVLPDSVATPGGMFTVSPTTGLLINSITGEMNISGSTPGDYIVTYTIDDNPATCLKGARVNFDITIENELDVDIDNDCINGNYTLTASPNDASYTYVWKNAAGTPVGTDSPTFNVSEYVTGVPNPVYPLEFTVTINNGCDATERFSVPNTSCNIPKGISPNGDGDNDEFDLTGFNVRKLEIFNRYGTRVYSRSNYIKEWVGQADNGNDLPDGTYYYVIERDNIKTATGWIQINRQRN